ncbi:MAG: hypothetical protein Q9191_006853, partial [Dirinaria sp. TL-2023a]
MESANLILCYLRSHWLVSGLLLIFLYNGVLIPFDSCSAQAGDTFRCEPNSVVFNSPTAYNAIYNSRANVKKSIFYEAWSRNEREINTFVAVDRAVHDKKRRVSALAFSDRSIQAAEEFIIEHVDRWCDMMLDGDNEGWSAPRNMAHWCDYLTFDILGDLCFGRSFESTRPEGKQARELLHTINKYMAYMWPIAKSPFVGLWVWLKPRGLDTMLEWISPPEIKRYYHLVEESVSNRTALEEKLQNESTDESHMRKDIFHYLFQSKDPDTGKPSYSLDELHAEAHMFIVAGSDTTAAVLSALFFYLMHYPEAYSKVTAELRTNFHSADDIRGSTSLNSCDYLRACLNEAMRMFPPGASELPRVVLPGGCAVDGFIYPEGTALGISSWALNYNERYFPDSHKYRPERWTVNGNGKDGFTADQVASAQSAFFPFSQGPYACLGKNLAWRELTIAAGRLLHRMNMRLPPGIDVGGGSPGLGWGREDKNQYLLRDAYIAIRDGPLLQFKPAG